MGSISHSCLKQEGIRVLSSLSWAGTICRTSSTLKSAFIILRSARFTMNSTRRGKLAFRCLHVLHNVFHETLRIEAVGTLYINKDFALYLQFLSNDRYDFLLTIVEGVQGLFVPLKMLDQKLKASFASDEKLVHCKCWYGFGYLRAILTLLHSYLTPIGIIYAKRLHLGPKSPFIANKPPGTLSPSQNLPLSSPWVSNDLLL